MVLPKKILSSRAIAFALLVIVSSALLSCEQIRDQPAFRPQAGPRLEAPAGAVSVQGAAPHYIPADTQGLTNPVVPSLESIEAGETVFNTYCAMCHGADGRGGGPVGQSFKPLPADLTAEFVSRLTDGQLFVMISAGIGRMPPFQNDLTEEERWQVVNYIRTLQR